MELADCLVSIVAHEPTASQAIAAVRRFLQHDQAIDDVRTDPAGLHTALYQRWTRMSDLPTTSYVALVIGCDLTMNLRRTLQDMHVMDSLDDVQDIVHCLTSNAQYFVDSSSALPLVTEVLLPVVIMFTWRSERNFLIRTLEEHSLLCSGIRQSIKVNKLLYRSGDEDTEDMDRWDQFRRLPARLDEHKFQSKNGRVLVDVVKQVIEQQQYSLAKTQNLQADDQFKEDIEDDDSLQQMCDVAVRALEYVTKECSAGHCIHTGDLYTEEPLQALELNLVADERSLEEYLKAKWQCDLSDYDTSSFEGKNDTIGLDEHKTTATEQLMALWDFNDSDTQDLDGILVSVQQELLFIRDMETLSINASCLLSAREGREFNGSSSFAVGIERQVQKIFNSLASDAVQEHEHVRSLVVLAAFSPARVIQEIVYGASLASQHHEFYMKVLYALPLLVEWQVHDTQPLAEFTRQARQILKDLVSDEDRFENRSVAFLDFCCRLSGVSGLDTPDNSMGVLLSLDSCIQDVVLPVYSSLTMKQTKPDVYYTTTNVNEDNYFQFLYQLTERAVSSIQTHWELNSTQNLFSQVLKAYADVRGDAASKRLDLLLLTLKNAMEMISRCGNPVLPVICDDLWSLLDARCLELVAPFRPTEYSRSEQYMSKLLDLVRENKSDDWDAMMIAEDAADTVEQLLWRILWNSMYSPQLTSSPCFQVMLRSEEIWAIIDSIADIDTGAFSGLNIIRREVKKLILACGSSLFVVAYESILLLLLKYDVQAGEKQSASQLTLPRFVVKPQEIDESIWNMHIDGLISSAHDATNMVIQFWREQTSEYTADSPSQDANLNLVAHIMECNNRAVTDSLSSLSGLLVCFRQLCFTASFAAEHLRESLDRDPFVQSQLDLALLRLLHLIGRANVSHAAEASFSAHFVACWLSILPESSYVEASRFLQSAQTAQVNVR